MGQSDPLNQMRENLDGRSQSDPLSFGVMFPAILWASFPLRIKRIKRGKKMNSPPNSSN